MSNLNRNKERKQKEDEDNESSSDNDSEDEDDKPELENVMIKHLGGVNRVRVCTAKCEWGFKHIGSGALLQ